MVSIAEQHLTYWLLPCPKDRDLDPQYCRNIHRYCFQLLEAVILRAVILLHPKLQQRKAMERRMVEPRSK